jgi:hypothetical protein
MLDGSTVHSSKRYPKDVPVTVRGIEAVGLSRLAVTGRWYVEVRVKEVRVEMGPRSGMSTPEGT